MASPTLHHVSTTDRNWKAQNTGGAFAVTKGLVMLVEKLVGEIPPPLFMVKMSCYSGNVLSAGSA